MIVTMFLLFGPIDMESKKRYQSDFYPIFHAINHYLDQLDELGIASLAGDRAVRQFADSFVQLVWRTWDALPFDAPLSSSHDSHGLDPKSQ